jgi:alkylated DNA repair dioxygenase AlkB
MEEEMALQKKKDEEGVATGKPREVMLALPDPGEDTSAGAALKLPLDLADVFYARSLVPQADEVYEALLGSLAWKKKPFENRATALYGDAGVEYAYGPAYGAYTSEDRTPLAWTPELLDIKGRVEAAVEAIDATHYGGEVAAALGGRIRFNVCLCNYYATGKEGIGFHADKEEADAATPIASISLGCPRTFLFTRSQRRRKGEREEEEAEGGDEGGEEDRTRYGIELASGSLLVMWKRCQRRYLHSIPKDKSVKTGRVNLTFRYLQPPSAT